MTEAGLGGCLKARRRDTRKHFKSAEYYGGALSKALMGVMVLSFVGTP